MNISDGPGIGVSLYVQGCALHCPGCFNEGTWDFDGGKEYTNDTMDTILDLLKPEWMTRLSILGGEPLCPANYKELIKLTYLAHEENKDKPDFKVWMWTGRTYENLMAEINSLSGADEFERCACSQGGHWVRDMAMRWNIEAAKAII